MAFVSKYEEESVITPHLKKLLFITGLITLETSFALNANESPKLSLPQCESLGRRYGDGTGYRLIDDSCQELVLNAALFTARRGGPQKDIWVYGTNNILYFDWKLTSSTNGTRKTHVISGPQSRLKQISAIATNNTDKELFVLDRGSKAILVFNLRYSGNVAPTRRLNNENFAQATSLAVDRTHGEILAGFSYDMKIEFYNLKADVDGLQSENSIKVRRTMDLKKTGLRELTDLCLRPNENLVYVLDKAGRQILAFDRMATENPSPLVSVPIDSSAEAISCLDSKEALELTETDGKKRMISP
jgi:hypothetical protein